MLPSHARTAKRFAFSACFPPHQHFEPPRSERSVLPLLTIASAGAGTERRRTSQVECASYPAIAAHGNGSECMRCSCTQGDRRLALANVPAAAAPCN